MSFVNVTEGPAAAAAAAPAAPAAAASAAAAAAAAASSTPSAANLSARTANGCLLLLSGATRNVELRARELLVILPPCRGAADHWAVGLGLEVDMQLSTLPGSEKLSLLIHPKVEGSALAPLEEAPPSWLQPARPLCAPAALLNTSFVNA